MRTRSQSRLTALFLTALLSASFWGCGRPSSAFEPASVSSSERLNDTSDAADVSSEPEPDVPTVLTVSGVITDAAMHTITIQPDLDEAQTFSTENAAITTGTTGLLIGNTAVITYEENTTDALSVSVSDSEENLLSARASELLETMTAEEKVRQMLIGSFTDLESVSESAFGGYILFARDFEDRTPEETAAFIESLQSASSLPLLIGVDEEGGEVNRISKYPAYRSSPFLSPQELYQEGGFERIKSDTAEKCALLKSLGINVNFAPVCDIAQPSDYIYGRTFGGDAETTSEYVRTVVSKMLDAGIEPVLKHFPGYGGSTDTHAGLAHDTRPLEGFTDSDLLPFEAGIDAGAGIVLVSHNIVECMDAENPASISPEVHRYLREEMGFDGVILTDDLAMKGITDFAGDQAALLAIQAGNDLLCCTNAAAQLPAVLSALSSGELSEERLNESVFRILLLKLRLGLFEGE